MIPSELTIPLTQGLLTVVSEPDFWILARFKWSAVETRPGRYYAVRREASKSGPVYMHRSIMGLDAGDARQVDHRDGNGLNNVRTNLRLATSSKNAQNRERRSDSASVYKGVHPTGGFKRPWGARICANGIKKTLGHFATAEEAARAYDLAALELHGEFARLNFPATEAAT